MFFHDLGLFNKPTSAMKKKKKKSLMDMLREFFFNCTQSNAFQIFAEITSGELSNEGRQYSYVVVYLNNNNNNNTNNYNKITEHETSATKPAMPTKHP